MKYRAILPLIAILLLTCGKNPADGGDDPDWIALTARVDGYRQIYLVDLNEPTRYKQITQNNHQNVKPAFFRDRTKLIYQDKTTGTTHNPELVLYDLEGDSVRHLQPPDDGIPFPLAGVDPIVFSDDDSGFYFTNSSSWVGNDALYYDFANHTVRNLTQTADPSEYVVGIKGRGDTLIVFSNDTSMTHQPWGIYLMDMNGNYISYVDNPHLELININGVNRKAAYNAEWNNELGLFVFAHKQPNVSGFRIAVTDLDGSHYEVYTSGNYMDDYPCWGPGGQTIFFQRRGLQDYSGPYKVMVLDLQSGKVEELTKPATVDGATSLSFPDY